MEQYSVRIGLVASASLVEASSVWGLIAFLLALENGMSCSYLHFFLCRMSMEIIFVIAVATGRTLVLPPKGESVRSGDLAREQQLLSPMYSNHCLCRHVYPQRTALFVGKSIHTPCSANQMIHNA